MQAGTEKLGVIEASYASAIIGVLSPVSSHCSFWLEHFAQPIRSVSCTEQDQSSGLGSPPVVPVTPWCRESAVHVEVCHNWFQAGLRPGGQRPLGFWTPLPPDAR